MDKDNNLSKYASFEVDDIVSEIKSKHADNKEATAYLDRSFIINMLNERMRQASINKLDPLNTKQIDFTNYNFTGADFRGIGQEHFELFDFRNCDISQVIMDREAIDFFLEYMREGKITWEGLNFEKANLSPRYILRQDIGIECYLTLDLSNLNLSGSSFRKANLQEVIFENTNISYCNFVDVVNLEMHQLAFSVGFELAKFSEDPAKDQEIKSVIKKYSETLDPQTYYKSVNDNLSSKMVARVANLFNFFGD